MTTATAIRALRSEYSLESLWEEGDRFLAALYPDDAIVDAVFQGLVRRGLISSENGVCAVSPMSAGAKEVMDWVAFMHGAVRDEMKAIGITPARETRCTIIEDDADSSDDDDNSSDDNNGRVDDDKTGPAAVFRQSARQPFPSVPFVDDDAGAGMTIDCTTASSPWSDVLVAVDYVTRGGLLSQRYKSCTSACGILGAQSNRYHCFTLVFAPGSEDAEVVMRAWYVDRCGPRRGSLQRLSRQSVKPLVRVLVGLMTMTDVAMGFSDTYRRASKREAEATGQEVKNVEDGETDTSFYTVLRGQKAGLQKITNVHVLEGPRQPIGRGTVLYTGVLDSHPIVLKESFCSAHRPYEGAMIERVHAANGGHASHIPTVVDYEADCDVLPSADNPAWLPMGKDAPARRRRRVVLRERLVPIRYAARPETLLIAFDGVLEAIIACIRAGIVHCDVSEGNVMLNSDMTTGYLIDFDLARDIAGRQEDAVGRDSDGGDGNGKGRHPVGTTLFTSCRLLGEHDAVNEHSDDLESVFWVLFWIAAAYKCPGKYDKRHALPYSKDFDRVDMLSMENLLKEDLDDELPRYVQTWYQALVPLLREWAAILFDHDRAEPEVLAREMQAAIARARSEMVDGGLKCGGMIRVEGTGIIVKYDKQQ
ncbi:hypothetical protein KEM52_002855 [Ascosphaera acerosa]|nr:hypothetical protein KEM52_002855 [Ascosphaera acerosa]